MVKPLGPAAASAPIEPAAAAPPLEPRGDGAASDPPVVHDAPRAPEASGVPVTASIAPIPDRSSVVTPVAPTVAAASSAEPEPAGDPAQGDVVDRIARPPVAPAMAGNGHDAARPASGNGHADGLVPGCTTAQMRRFIKSRPWIPMHELRRRFAINGHEDDVTPVAVGPRTLFVGLPEREGRMLGELLRGGDVGYELSVDPDTPVVIGVFPMRPVARP